MVVSKRENPNSELQSGDVTMKHIQKFNNVESVLTDDGVRDKEYQWSFV